MSLDLDRLDEHNLTESHISVGEWGVNVDTPVVELTLCWFNSSHD